VLAILARNSSKVLLHRETLQGVSGNEYGEETDYVWTFVQRIRRKIEADRSHPKYVLTILAWSAGTEPTVHTRSGPSRAAAVLGALARNASELLAVPRRHQLHACQRPGCVLLFLARRPERR
jgi:predicted RNA-binding Zn ribbon-like protein